MFTPAILAATLSAPIPLAPQLARVEVEHGPDSAHVLAFDVDGEVAAEIVVWAVEANTLRFEALFPDGLGMSAVIRGDDVTIDSEDLDAVAARLVAVNVLAAASEPQASWTECAAYAAITAWELSHASPIGIATAILAACKCIPEIVDEFEGMECY